MRMRNIRSLIYPIVATIVITVVASCWSGFFSRRELEYRVETLRVPRGIYSLTVHVTSLWFKNSGRAKLANVPIKCYSENPGLRLIAEPTEVVKNKSELDTESLDMSAMLRFATRIDEEVTGMGEMLDTEYFSRLEWETVFSIEALDLGRYSVYYMVFCSMPSEKVVSKDDINLISPDPNVNLLRVEKLSKPISIWFILFAASAVINAVLASYLAIRKKKERRSPNL